MVLSIMTGRVSWSPTSPVNPTDATRRMFFNVTCEVHYPRHHTGSMRHVLMRAAPTVIICLPTLYYPFEHDHANMAGANPNDIEYKRWSGHNGFGKLLCKLYRHVPPPDKGKPIYCFGAIRMAGTAHHKSGICRD